MRRLLFALIAVLSLLVVPMVADLQQPPAGTGAAPAPGRGGRGGPLPPATQPMPRDDARHAGFLEIARRGDIDLLWVGDSITDWWARAGLEVWNENFATLKAANFGIAGDTTQGVLWRMQNGELEGFRAKLIVLMLGTNNINRNPNHEIADGVGRILDEFRARQPQAKVLLLGVFPRGAQPDNPFRASIKEINTRLATFADDNQVFYMDIGDRFLAADGTLPVEMMPDGLHPSTAGYRVWAAAVRDRVYELMR